MTYQDILGLWQLWQSWLWLPLLLRVWFIIVVLVNRRSSITPVVEIFLHIWYHLLDFFLVYFAIIACTVLGFPLPRPFLRNSISLSFKFAIKDSLMVLFLFFLSQTKNFLFSTGCQWTHVSPFLTVVFVGFLFNLVFPSDFDFLAFKSFLFSFAGFLFGFFLFYPSSKFESEDILSFGKDSLTVTRKLGFLLPEIFGGRFSSQMRQRNVVFGWKWLLFGDNWVELSLFLFQSR